MPLFRAALYYNGIFLIPFGYRRACVLKFSPAFKGTQKRDLVDILEIPADRDTAGDPGHFDACRLDPSRLELVAMMTSFTSSSRSLSMSSFRRMSAGPTPSMGEIAPCST